MDNGRGRGEAESLEVSPSTTVDGGEAVACTDTAAGVTRLPSMREACFLFMFSVKGSFSWLHVTADIELMDEICADFSFGSVIVSRGVPLVVTAVMVDCSSKSSVSVFLPKLLLSVSTEELPLIREGGLSDWSSSSREWVGLAGKGGVTGRKCKGLDSEGTGVGPSS